MKRLLRKTSFYSRRASVFCVFTVFAVAFTVRSEPSAPDYLLDVWSTEQGLPNATISGIAQTPDGYLWCGTYDGVVRFDGARFVRIGPDDSTNQEANRVQCLLVDRRGQLWIGTDGAGLLNYSNGKFITFAERAGSSMNAIRSIAEDGDGNLWLGTRGGIGRFRNGRTEWFTDSRGLTNSSKSVWNLAFDRTGGLWVADWTSLKVFDGREFLTPSIDPAINVPLRAVYCDDEGVMWAGMVGQALRREADGTWAGVDDDGLFTNVEVTTFCKTSAGEFWAGTRRGLCRAGPDGRWSNFTPRGAGVINSDVRVLFEDRERNLWVGTGSAGLVRLKRRIVETYSVERGIAEGPVFGACEKRDGGLLLALNNGHVVHSAGTNAPFHRLPGIPSDAPIKTMLQTRDGALWIGTFGDGLFRIPSFNSSSATVRNRPVRLRPTVGSPARIDRVTALLEDRDGNIWIGSYYSLYKGGDSNTVVPVTVGGREMRAPAIALLQDRAGDIWVGWEGFGVSRLRGEEAMWLTRREGLPTHFIRAFHEDTSGVLWIGTTAGLCSWRDGELHTITKAHGLIDDSIVQILQDDSDNLWLGSNKGIMRVARKELLAVADGKKTSLELFACGRGEGMLSEQCSGAFSPAAVKTAAGKLCFPTANGLVVVDPVHLKLTMNPEAPPVYIEEVRADGKIIAQPYVTPGPAFSKAGTVPLVLDAGTRRLEFDFTAPSLTAPERVRFKYRLEGFDTGWTEATTSRSAVYPNITPGRYSFHVLACNADSVWNQVGHVMTFRVAAPFWQTWWFLGIAAVGSAGLVGGGVRLVAVRNLRRRLRRLEEAHAIEKERMRIAQDMHDEIGGKLSRISFLSDMARHNVPENSKAGHQIEEVSEAAREVIRTVDEIVWAVSPRNDTIESVVHYICRHAEEFFELTSVELELDLPRDFPDCRLSAEVRHNLFCAVKESLNNVLKHAAATRVRIAFIVTAAAFKVRVTDDGHGFSRAAGREFAMADGLPGPEQAVATRVGNGLLNMRERLQSVHGAFTIESETGKGTKVTFELPLA